MNAQQKMMTFGFQNLDIRIIDILFLTSYSFQQLLNPKYNKSV